MLWLSVAAAILYAPWWGMVLLAGLLIAQVVLVRRWATTHPGRCVAVPLVGFVAWLALVLAGAWWFGWEMKV